MPDDTLKLALVGYGRMGRLLDQLAPEHGLEVMVRLDEHNNAGGAGLTREGLAGVDVAIDFSIPETVADNAINLAELGVATVVGATGWLDRLDEVRSAVER